MVKFPFYYEKMETFLYFFDKIRTLGVNTMAISTDIDYESYLSDSCLSDFLRIIKKNPAATSDDNFAMFAAYNDGNEDMKQNIAERNLALVVAIVRDNYKNIDSEQRLEYIQNGFIGLMEAIDRYDMSKGTTFSTYAEYYIQMRINRYRYDNEKLVRRPHYLYQKKSKYRKLISEYEKSNTPLPSKEEICTIIEVSLDTLKRIEEDFKLDALSYDAPLDAEDEDSDNLLNTVVHEVEEYNDVLDKIVIEELLKTLKMTLSRYEYYVLYYRVLNPERRTYEDISNSFNVTRQAIQQTESKILEKVKKMYDDNHTLKRKYVERVKVAYPFDSIKLTPCEVDDFILYFYLRDNYSKKDQIILREMLIGDLEFSPKRVAREIKESIDYVEKKKRKIEDAIKLLPDNTYYKLFHNNILDKYGSRLYYLDLEADISELFDYRKIIKDYWKDKTLEEALSIASENNISLTEEKQDKIKRFFGIAPKMQKIFPKERLERDVNYALYGFATNDLPLGELYSFFMQNQELFTDNQIAYLNKMFFKKDMKEEDDNNLSSYNGQSIVDKLTLLYYNVEDYRNDNFTKEKYISVRKKCLHNIDERGVRLLDLYYGVFENKRRNIREMSEYLGEDENVVETDFRRSKNNAIALYLGTNQYTFDKSIYAKVLLDENFNLGDPHYEVAYQYFVLDKSYGEIADSLEVEPKLTQRRVGELVKYACAVMDNYRFGILSTEKNYSKEFLSEVLEKSDFNDTAKKILKTFIKNKDTVLTSKIHHHDLNKVRYYVRKLNASADKIAIKDVEVTYDDIVNSVLEHDSVNILNERERIILSYLYGLENQYNLKGEKKKPQEIAEALGIKHNISCIIKHIKERVAAHKVGILKTPLDFIDRSYLEEVLRDTRLPISDDDKQIIINAYGLYGTKFMSRNEIGKSMGIKEPVVRSRLYKSIIAIGKYQNGEIPGYVDFEIDVEPYLKYFIIEDREILTLLYKYKVSQEEIEKRYNLSTHQLQTLLQKMRMHLDDLQKDKKSGIDFDYFWTNDLESDVPYYGNQKLAVEICFLYYEKRLSQSDIVKYYHPELGDTSVSEIIRGYTAAMIKHQNGIRKANEFTSDEVADYYERHKDEFGSISMRRYQIYFNKIKKNGPFARVRPNKYITYDLIKEKYPDLFRLDKATPELVYKILGDHWQSLPRYDINLLESLFGVTHPNVLKEEDWLLLGSIQLFDEEKHHELITHDNKKLEVKYNSIN